MSTQTHKKKLFNREISKFNNLSTYILKYISSFYSIEDSFNIINVNKRMRSIIEMEPSIITKFISMRNKQIDWRDFYYCLQEDEDLKEMLSTLAIPLSGGDPFSREQQEDLIQNLLCNYLSDCTEIRVKRPSLEDCYYLNLLLSASKCPINSLYIYFGDPNNSETFPTEEEIEVANKFSELLKTNSSLKKLQLFTRDTDKFINIYNGLAENKSITDLYLYIPFKNNNLFLQYMPIVYNSLNENKTITNLKFCCISTSTKESEGNSMGDFLSQNTTIKSLELYECYFKKPFYPFEGLRYNDMIQVLKVSITPFPNYVMKLISKIMIQRGNSGLETKLNTSIHTLKIEEIVKKHFENFTAIGEILNNNNTIKNLEVGFYFYESDPKTCEPLLAAIKVNFSLISLTIKSSFWLYREDEFRLFIDALRVNKTLTNVFVFD